MTCKPSVVFYWTLESSSTPFPILYNEASLPINPKSSLMIMRAHSSSFSPSSNNSQASPHGCLILGPSSSSQSLESQSDTQLDPAAAAASRSSIQDNPQRIAFQSKVLSREHATLKMTQHGNDGQFSLSLQDHDSTHGTFLSRRNASSSQFVQHFSYMHGRMFRKFKFLDLDHGLDQEGGDQEVESLTQLNPNQSYRINNGDYIQFGKDVEKDGVIHGAVRGYIFFDSSIANEITPSSQRISSYNRIGTPLTPPEEPIQEHKTSVAVSEGSLQESESEDLFFNPDRQRSKKLIQHGKRHGSDLEEDSDQEEDEQIEEDQGENGQQGTTIRNRLYNSAFDQADSSSDEEPEKKVSPAPKLVMRRSGRYGLDMDDLPSESTVEDFPEVQVDVDDDFGIWSDLDDDVVSNASSLIIAPKSISISRGQDAKTEESNGSNLSSMGGRAQRIDDFLSNSGRSPRLDSEASDAGLGDVIMKEGDEIDPDRARTLDQAFSSQPQSQFRSSSPATFSRLFSQGQNERRAQVATFSRLFSQGQNERRAQVERIPTEPKSRLACPSESDSEPGNQHQEEEEEEAPPVTKVSEAAKGASSRSFGSDDEEEEDLNEGDGLKEGDSLTKGDDLFEGDELFEEEGLLEEADSILMNVDTSRSVPDHPISKVSDEATASLPSAAVSDDEEDSDLDEENTLTVRFQDSQAVSPPTGLIEAAEAEGETFEIDASTSDTTRIEETIPQGGGVQSSSEAASAELKSFKIDSTRRTKTGSRCLHRYWKPAVAPSARGQSHPVAVPLPPRMKDVPSSSSSFGDPDFDPDFLDGTDEFVGGQENEWEDKADDFEDDPNALEKEELEDDGMGIVEDAMQSSIAEKASTSSSDAKMGTGSLVDPETISTIPDGVAPDSVLAPDSSSNAINQPSTQNLGISSIMKQRNGSRQVSMSQVEQAIQTAISERLDNIIEKNENQVENNVGQIAGSKRSQDELLGNLKDDQSTTSAAESPYKRQRLGLGQEMESDRVRRGYLRNLALTASFAAGIAMTIGTIFALDAMENYNPC